MSGKTREKAEKSISRLLMLGYGLVLVLVVGIGGIAATTQISGAVIAPGSFVVSSHVKKVQHPTGGIVAQLNVQNGDAVKAGDLLIRLDETKAKASLEIVSSRLDEAAARKARLVAERDDLDEVKFPQDLLDRRSEPEIAELLEGELRVFSLRKAARAGEKAQLTARIAQLQQELDGLRIQEKSKASEITLMTKEIKSLRALWDKRLIALSRITAVERDAVRVQGERGALAASQAQVKGRISEIELQVAQIDQDLRSEVARELRDIEAQIAEDSERKIAAVDELSRIDIRAPQAGVVHQLNAHTIGGVVAAGEPILLIVPTGDALMVEARIQPQDVDQVALGQDAVLRLSAFNYATTPEISGRVSFVSADLSADEKTGLNFYTIRIEVVVDELARIGNLEIVPGMPVEAFVQTGSRSILSYLVKPIADQLSRAFREN